MISCACPSRNPQIPPAPTRATLLTPSHPNSSPPTPAAFELYVQLGLTSPILSPPPGFPQTLRPPTLLPTPIPTPNAALAKTNLRSRDPIYSRKPVILILVFSPPSTPLLSATQLRVGTDNNIFSKYGCPSHPISPTALAVPTDAKMTTSRNEQGEIDNRNTTAGSQSDLEKHPQQYNHQQQLTLPPSTIPPELIDHIINHLHDDKQSLTQCSRTSRVFSHAMSYHLFGTVRILDRSQRWPAFATRRSLTTCARSLGLAGQWRAPVSSSLPSEFHPGTIG